MCGIAGIYAPHAPVPHGALTRALAAMRHRGPDGAGSFTAPDGRVALGHARLAVMDLAGGAQPIASEDGSLVAVINGELYDHEALRTALEARGHVFRTRSDSEIALHLFEDHGPSCLGSLRGEFALLIWDARNRALFAARDRFGAKPLCYAQRGATVYLASEAKALFAAGFPAQWDDSAFFHAASMQYVPPDRTLFAGVRQLRPGHYLYITDGLISEHSYWDLSPLRLDRAPSRRSEASLTEELAARLDEAVRLRLRADVPVACYLSGGLDSAAVLGLTARHSTHSVACFTVSFAADGYDELPVARRTADRAGAALHTVRLTQEDLVAALPDAVTASEGLAINGHLSAKYLLSAAVQRAGYKVILSGEGADEVFAGYAHLRRDLLVAHGASDAAAFAALSSRNTASAGVMLPGGDTLPLGAVQRALGFIPSWLEAKAALGFRTHAVLADAFLERHAQRDAFALTLAGMDVPGQLAGRHPVEQSLYLWSKLALANYILRTLGDGTEMAHGIEGRLPFLDHPLVEFAREIPVDLKIRRGVEKYLLREATRPVLTDEVYRREKHPFLAPPVSRFAGSALAELLQDTLRSAAMRAVPFYSPPKLCALLDALPRMDAAARTAVDPVLMTALCAAILQARYALAAE